MSSSDSVSVFHLPYTSDINKVYIPFTFYNDSMTVLQCECCSENSVNCCYTSTLHTLSTVSSIVTFFEHVYRYSLCPTLFYLGYVIGPGSLPSGLCLALEPLTELEIQRQHNQWLNLAHQAKAFILQPAYPWKGFVDFYIHFNGRP